MDPFGIAGERTIAEISADFEGCRFCWALSASGQRFPSNAMVWSDTDYVLLPALGALVPEHLLLVSRHHTSCVASLNGEQLMLLATTLAKVREEVVRRVASSWVFFEHGSTLASSVKACCIDHLHIHLIPLDHDLATDIAHRTSTPAVPLGSLAGILSETGSEPCNYILIENTDRSLWVIKPPAYPSQYVRQVIASRLGIATQWDWRDYPRIEHNISMLRRLRQLRVAPRQIYFAHAIEGVPHDVLVGEIQAVRSAFVAGGTDITVASMYDLFEQSRASPMEAKVLVSREIEFLKSCDALVVDLSRPGWQYAGALMEIVYAKVHHLPVIAIVGKSNLGERVWIRAHVDHRVQSLTEAVEVTRGILAKNNNQSL